MVRLYYTPPKDEYFNEVKEKAIQLWFTMGDEPSYSREKIGRIKDLKNIEDNFMYMIAMFDIYNQRRLSNELSEETRKAIRERMIEGGNPPHYIVF